jgi:hypothetical protein
VPLASDVFRWRLFSLDLPPLRVRRLPTLPPGYNHSGKLGQINFPDGVMGYANAQCMLGYILVVVEFISQPEYKGLIPMFGIVDEGACLLQAQ